VYKGGTRALAGVDLQVDEGRIYALLGPNGAGKTTLVRILTTQLRPTKGSARVLGLDVVRDAARVRTLIGYVPQEMSVWTDITGRENLLLYSKIYEVPSSRRAEVIDDALRKMGLYDVRDGLVGTYSGGMIRRLEIACTLLARPRLLFLDEPTIGLDPAARRVVWEELTSFKDELGATVFFNTHYMDEAQNYSDGIAIIDQGRMVVTGTSDELRRSVGGEVVRLTLEGHGLPPDVLGRVRDLPVARDALADGREVRVVVEDAEAALPQVMDALRTMGVQVARAAITKPSLDDVFLRYAGKRLGTEGRAADARQVRRMIKRG
jgi:ABC-2 type transport system ATP-binding protein